jgi:hypothetical protein
MAKRAIAGSGTRSFAPLRMTSSFRRTSGSMVPNRMTRSFQTTSAPFASHRTSSRDIQSTPFNVQGELL